jgi:signal recognition particle subunit SRP54
MEGGGKGPQTRFPPYSLDAPVLAGTVVCEATLRARMFDTLSDKLQATLGDLTGRGRLSDEDLSRAAREIRLSLLEADVNFKVVKEFVATVKERAAGADVLKSLTPGQQVVKIVHEELTTLMGTGSSKLAFAGRPPTVILLAGLQGSGKTTAAAKLALLLRKEGKTPALVACDLQRPAAIDQLEQLGKQIQIPVYAERGAHDPVAVAAKGLEQARAQGRDVVIVDTAGRLHVDEEMMEQLVQIRRESKPHNVLLVLDAMTGQDAVSVAEAFSERVEFDGVVLTKLDGDARGGAALSVKAVTGKPVKLASTGEKLDQLEYFHPDRMASRILGMGDVLTLIERAEAAVEQDEHEEMERRLRQGRFTFDDFLASYKMMRRMGPLQNVLGMMPGMGKHLRGVKVDDRDLGRDEAIELSMTPDERRRPEIINGPRRARIARGSGTSVQQVNQLLLARKQMQKLMKQFGRGKMPNLQSIMAQQRR